MRERQYGFASMALRSLFSRTPPYLVFFVTSRCDARCVTCFNWRNLNSKRTDQELTLQEIERIADSCKRSVFLSLSGGEPFLRDDIAGICGAFSARAGTMMINIPTNCLRPEQIRDRTLQILKACPRTILQIELSIDGIGAVHDTIRGVPGNFAKALETFGKLRELQPGQPRLRLKVCSVLNRYNRHQISDLMEFVQRSMPVDDHSIVPVHGEPRDESVRGDPMEDFREAAALADSLRDRGRPGLRALVFREVQSLARQSMLDTLGGTGRRFVCPGGSKIAVIGETGLVYPCETMMTEPLGDLREGGYSLPRILSGRAATGKCQCGWSCAHLASVLFSGRGRMKLALRMAGLPFRHRGKRN
jgi:MoaA/NifB/PqqE/SkfB family radical SAM enzyme